MLAALDIGFTSRFDRNRGLLLFLPVRLRISMANYTTTKLSSRGQVVIPEEVRNDLGLKEGDQFIVIGRGDAVILKTITPPKLQEFERILTLARTEARKAGIRKSDVKTAVSKIRRRTK